VESEAGKFKSSAAVVAHTQPIVVILATTIRVSANKEFKLKSTFVVAVIARLRKLKLIGVQLQPPAKYESSLPHGF